MSCLPGYLSIPIESAGITPERGSIVETGDVGQYRASKFKLYSAEGKDVVGDKELVYRLNLIVKDNRTRQLLKVLRYLRLCPKSSRDL